MADGETQNIQGFLSDILVIIMEHITPYGHCLNVEHLVMKVTCPDVSEKSSQKR